MRGSGRFRKRLRRALSMAATEYGRSAGFARRSGSPRARAPKLLRTEPLTAFVIDAFVRGLSMRGRVALRAGRAGEAVEVDGFQNVRGAQGTPRSVPPPRSLRDPAGRAVPRYDFHRCATARARGRRAKSQGDSPRSASASFWRSVWGCAANAGLLHLGAGECGGSRMSLASTRSLRSPNCSP